MAVYGDKGFDIAEEDCLTFLGESGKGSLRFAIFEGGHDRIVDRMGVRVKFLEKKPVKE